MASDDDDSPHLVLSTFWYEKFDEKFKEFSPDRWELEPTEAEMRGKGWHRFQDKSKVKFLCSDCGRSWTSMKGVIMFWHRLDRHSGKGSLRFKLFGQKCANDTKDFQNARWYREEIEKVLSNVHQKIGERFYNFEKASQDDKVRHGAPRKPHNKKMCEACQMGWCFLANPRKPRGTQ